MNHMRRTIPRWILAFIGSLLLFATLALVCIRMTLFNQDFMIQQVRRTGYVETICKDMTESIQDLGRGSNIPPEVLADVVPKEMVSSNVENYIRSIYQEIPFELQGENLIKENILKNVDLYAKQKNYTIDDATHTNLNSLAESATKNYSSYIEIPYLLEYGKKVMSFRSSLNLILILVAVAALFIFLGLIMMVKMKHQRMRWSSIVFFGAGLMLIVLPAAIYFSV